MKRVKKARTWTAFALLCVLLCACAGPAAGAPAGATSAGAETPAPAAQPSPAPWAEEDSEEEVTAARAAYRAALETLLRSDVLPDRSGLGNYHAEWNVEGMSKHRFAVCDVDRDGREELVLLYNASTMAGMCGYVLGWDGEARELRTQLEEFPQLTFYESGAVKAMWSHNQGKGGRFWPYNLYRYDAFTDQYAQVGAVDAWDESLGIEGYPREADASESGFVYYINTNGWFDWDDPLDESVYRAWSYPYLRDTAELEIDYLPLTEENIRALIAPKG